MDFTVITIYTTHEGIEPVTGRLYSLGINGVEIEDKEDFEEFLTENTENWEIIDEELKGKISGETKIKAYTANNASGAETVELIRESMNELKQLDSDGAFGRLEIELSSTSEEDWANGWKQYYKPTRIGRRIVIVPEWEKYDAQRDEAIVLMNPGAAFGTGTHESTRLCLEFVEEFVTKDTSMLDIGTGSGILAVTALKLGAKNALGIDIDELAATVAGENAALNGVTGNFSACRGDLAQGVGGRFDLITANIVADVIIRLAPDVPRHLAQGGIFVASGIIDTRESAVKSALQEYGLNIFAVKKERGWVSMACRL